MQARQLRRARGEPQILRQAPPMSGARPYCLCPALPLMRGAVPCLTAYVWCFALLTSTGPAYVLCLRAVRCGAVLCLPSTPPPYVQCPGCFALLTCGAVWCSALLRQGPGCFDRPRLPLMCFAVLCLLRQPLALPSTPPGVLCPALPLMCFACFASTPPGGALLCSALLALLMCLRVFYTY